MCIKQKNTSIVQEMFHSEHFVKTEKRFYICKEIILLLRYIYSI